ncbi:hypothetical protein RFI_17627 [Reticulomyxa filosa]|uniref:Uncharacterized protein n=1 Tax=Reticulomyxa filosa TaxID=46433 RepID=X6N0K5_RETFI|nr:hypothetical protein RFI_17627 [Reticulomyxa filosa]|eukprot:ETO19606.1 hypothetical protein RFI_17627 [Reticulomyxa filosa]
MKVVQDLHKIKKKKGYCVILEIEKIGKNMKMIGLTYFCTFIYHYTRFDLLHVNKNLFFFSFKKKKMKQHAEWCLRKDLYRDRVVWTGEWSIDYRIYLSHHHALFFMCAHPWHPLDRKRRLLITINVLLLDMPFAYLRDQIKSTDYAQNVLYILFSALVLFLFTFVLEKITVCPCFDKRKCYPCCRKHLKMWGCLSACFFTFIFFLIVLTLELHKDFFTTRFCSAYIQILIWDWAVYSIVYTSLCFLYYRRREMKVAILFLFVVYLY